MNRFARFWRPSAVDLASPRIVIDPFPHYERLRRAGPVQYLSAHDFWIALGYDAVKEAFEQPTLFSNAPYSEVDAVLLASDPPRHGIVRRILSGKALANALERTEATAAAAARRLIRPEMDVVRDYGHPITRAVAADLIGFDDATVAEIAAAGGAVPDPLAALVEKLDSVAPRAPLFDALLADSQRELSPAEAASLIRLLWLATTTTTERVITRSVLLLLQHDHIRTALAASPSLLPKFIEEVMRLHPPEHMVPRLVTAPATLGGVRIRAGEIVQLCVSAANRDPCHFEAPAELRLDRPSRRHFAFGYGVHGCLGAAIARRVVAAALAILLEPGRNLHAREPLSRLRWFRTMTALSPERLEIGL